MSYASDIAFTETVKAIQVQKGPRVTYARIETNGNWNNEITPNIAEYIGKPRSFFLVTSNAEGQPTLNIEVDQQVF